MADIIVVISKKDIASINIYEELRSGSNLKFLLVDTDIIHADVSKVKADYVVFASRHKSEVPRKTLSVHPIGNWSKAEYGGKEGMLSATSSYLLKTFFIELNKQAKEAKVDYEVTLEATHHGPYVSKPCLFIEIGSSEKEWRDKGAGKIIAKTIIAALEKFELLNHKEVQWKTALGFGGGHYCQAFNKPMLQDEYAISHIASKYALPFLNEKLIEQAIAKTQEKVEIALLDWKGLSGERERLLALLKKVGLPYEKV